MRKNYFYWLLAISTLLFVFASCKKDNEDKKAEYADYSCLIVNQGNFTEKNGSISYYREADNSIANKAFSAANQRDLAAFVESAAVYDTLALIICNTPDKIEMINVHTAKANSAPIEGADVITPRYAVINNKYAYVSCWGLPVQDGWWDEEHLYPRYIYPDSYILKIDIKTKSIIKKIPCGNEAEGLLLYNNKLYAAVDGGIEIYNTDNDSKIKTVNNQSLYGQARHMVIDKNAKIWYSVESAGFALLDPVSETIEYEYSNYSIGASFCVNKQKDKLVFYAITWGQPNVSEVYTLNVDSKTVSGNAIFNGEYFNGIAANPFTGMLYTAEMHGFTTNSTLKIFTEQGATTNNEVRAGIAASRFVFF
jgi:hypothetical protein